MLAPIPTYRGDGVDPALLARLKAIPKDRLLIAADLHWTLCEGGAVPSRAELALFEKIHDATSGGLVIVSNSDVADVDAELYPLKLPMVGRGHLQIRLDPAGGIEVPEDAPPFDFAAVREVERFVTYFSGFSVRFAEPYIDLSIKMDRERAVADHYERLKLMDRIYVYTEAVFIDVPTVTIERGFDYLYVSHGRPDKAEAIARLMRRYPERTLIGLGDEVSKEGPMLRAINAAGGYGFYVFSPFTYSVDRSYTHDILADHRAALMLLRALFAG